jgi:hypothetical protein
MLSYYARWFVEPSGLPRVGVDNLGFNRALKQRNMPWFK